MPADKRAPDNGNYHAFLVRVSRPDADQPWEMVAKDVETGEEYPLPGPDGLFQFLTDRLPVFQRNDHGPHRGTKKF